MEKRRIIPNVFFRPFLREPIFFEIPDIEDQMQFPNIYPLRLRRLPKRRLW